MKKLPLLASTLLAATALAVPAFAEDLTWAGTTDSTWDTTTENWSGESTTFTTGDNVTFDGSDSQKSITLGEAITAGNITFTEGGYTISGSDYSLTAGTIAISGADGSTVTIATSTITATAINFANHGNDNQQDDYKHLVIGDGENVTTATADSMSILGQSEISVAANSTLTVSGDVGFGGGYYESISGDGSIVIGGTANHTSGQPLVISIASFQAGAFTNTSSGTTTFSGGSVTIGTFTEGSGATTFSGGTVTIGTYTGGAGTKTFSAESTTITSMTTGSGATTFSGTSSAVDYMQFSSSGVSLTYTGSGTHTIGELESHVSGAATLDYSELTGSLIITKLDFGNSSTLTINGNDKGTITEVSFTNTGVTLEVNGTVNVGTMNITTNNDTPTINIGEDATLNVTTMNVYPGGFGSGYYTKVNGVSADTSTFITGTLTIGSGTTGAGLEVKNTTFITGGITFSHEATSNGYFYLYLDDVTLGFTQSTTIEAGGGISSYIELGDHGSGTGFDTTATASTTVINTNQYNTTDGAFTSTGLSIEIQEAIAGTGTLEVTGNGKLTLSGENTYSGGTKVTSGTVVANNASALGSGDVTVKGGQLEIGSEVTISNTISITLTEAYFDIYALTGEGAIADGATIEITVDSAVAALLADGGEYTFDIYDSQLSGLSSTNFDTTALEEYGTVSWDQGVLTIVSDVPEPSMFGLMFGLGAIGLVATRRRRR